jgi:alpha-beta hydrolase superfamily lysophospholipase
MRGHMQTHASMFHVTSSGGPAVTVRSWRPDEKAIGVVVIAHGAAEHGGRYERFAQSLNDRGYAVYASDHRGHGGTAAGRLGVAGADGWNGTIRDVAAVLEHARSENPGLPIFLFGHSMGSVVAQRFIQLHGSELAGVILSGSVFGLPAIDVVIEISKDAARGDGADQPSAIFGEMFAGFNAPFEARTGFEWLSRDQAEVQKYVDDPACGFPFSNGMLADFLSGWEVAWDPKNDKTVPRALPMLIFSGDQDPVGENTVGVKRLAERYRKLGLTDVELVFYPGARHEMLNETNRDEVEADVADWLDKHVPD